MLNSGRRGRRAPDGYGILSVNEKFNQTSYPTPIIDSWAITDGSYVPTDDTALDIAGGQTVVVYGSGFTSGVTVNINGSNISPVTLLDSGRITFTAPALASATYTIYVSNSNGATAIYVPGLVYSGLPTWSSPAAGSIGSNYETKSTSLLSSNTFIATGDAPITYSIASGSLPSGVSLSSNGVLSGSLPATSSPTTYSFTIRATDAQNQDSNRSFSLTINPDVITWIAPSQNGTLTVYETKPFSTPLSATSAAGYGVMYAANTLPTGITLATDTGAFSGYANTVGTTNVQFTATANTTNRYALSNVLVTVTQDSVSWSSPANNTTYTLNQSTEMSPVTLTATSAAGYGVQYTANSLPTGVTLSNGTVSGTPTVQGTTTTQFTATANTTNRVAYVYINWSVSVAADTYFANNVLFLSANSQLQTTNFVADSSNNNTQLINFDSRVSNYNPYQPGYYSTQFNGSSDNLVVTASSAFTFGTGDFTIEFWMYANAVGPADVVATYRNNTSGDWQFYLDGSGVLSYYPGGASTYGTSQLAVGRWYHVAGTRQGDTVRFFVNGALAWTSTGWAASSMGANQTVQVGAGAIGVHNDGFFNGSVSNLRILKGTALYTSAFTPTTSPLTAVANTVLLTCQSNRFIDNSLLNSTITPTSAPKISTSQPFGTPYQANTQYYSTYFDGTGDYLEIAHNTNQWIGAGVNFTIECWIYLPSAQSGEHVILAKGYQGSPAYGQFILTTGTSATQTIQFLASTDGSTFGINILDSTTLVPQTWYHIAAVRNGSTISLYKNGVSVGTPVTNSNALYNHTGTIRIGSHSSGSGFIGHISNVRLNIGTALYTSNFTPPTAPLTAVANTRLLTSQSSTFIDNSTNAFTITGNGDAKPLAVSPFTPLGYTTTPITTYGSSYHLNPTRDSSQIYTPTGAVYNVGSSDFTLEFWVNFNDTTTQQQELFRFDGATIYNPYLMLWSSNAFYFRTTETTGDIVTAFSSGITAGQWVHLCITRSGNNYTIYRNGISVATGTSTGVVDENKKLVLGSGSFKGYLSDVKFTKGSVLYTSNFVPEFTRPNTVSANTQLLTLQTNGAANNSNFKDESGFSLPITRNGNVTQGTFSPYGDNFSTYFDNSSSLYNGSCSIPIGTGDFTLEFWMYFTGTDGTRYDLLSADSSAQIVFYRYSDNTFSFYWNTTNRISVSGFTAAAYGNRWVHVALVKNSNSTKLYFNGTQVGSTYTDTNNYGTFTTMYLGSNSNSIYYLGYISNFRIVSGTALYTNNFTPPTSPLTAIANTQLLICNTNRFQDLSPKNYALTSAGSPKVQKFSPFSASIVPKHYSTYFNTSGNEIDYSNPAAGPTGTEDFTWECWWYFLTQPGGSYPRVFESTVPNSFQIYFNGSTLTISQNGGSTVLTYALTSVNEWVHLCITRSGSAMRLFVNGVLRAYTASGGTNFAAATGSYWRVLSQGSGPHGYLSNLRVVRGSVVSGYQTSSTTTGTTIFTPPTSPLTAIANTSLLAHNSSAQVDGSGFGSTITTNATNITIVPVSPFTPTANTGLTYSPSTFGGSMYFDGTGDFLDIASSPAVQIGSSEFTIQGWFYPTTATNYNELFCFDNAIGGGYAAIRLRLNSSKQLELYMSTSGGSWAVASTSSGTLNLNAWNHVAVVRSVNTVTVYINGIASGISAAFSGTGYTTSGLKYSIGCVYSSSTATEFWQGYISDFNMVKGKALYTANFYPGNPPTTPVVYSNNSTTIANTAYSTLLVNGTSGGIIDQSRTVDLETVGDAKVTNFSPYNGSNYSAYFTNSGSDYATFTNNTVTAFSGTFTIEFWVYFTSISGSSFQLTGVNASGALTLYYDTSNSNRLCPNVYGTGNIFVSTFTPVTGVWYHIAMARDSNNLLRMWVNGSSVGSTTKTGTFTTGAYQFNPPGTGAALYLSNYRINSTAVYDPSLTTITVPTTPLTAITGTSLLTFQSNKFVDNSTNATTLTLGGTPKVQTQNPFGLNSGQSYYFDGTGDSLFAPTTSNFSFGTGDFTVEFWLYFNSTSNRQDIIWISTAANSNDRLGIIWNQTAGKLTYYISPSPGNAIDYTWTPTAGQWYHIALTRASGLTKLFVNGTQAGSSIVDSRNYSSAFAVYVGQDSGAASSYFNGYLSDLRITRGVARYTSNNTTYLNNNTPYLNK